MNLQKSAVGAFYDKIADKYDEQFETKADYRVPSILKTEFARNGFLQGSVLDIGCGTGKLIEYLDGKFTLEGIEVSHEMAKTANRRGYREVYYGSAEEVLLNRPTKSFDHVVALSSLYSNTHLWTRPSNGKEIFGDVVHKLIQPSL